MSDVLTARLNKILPKLLSDDLLQTRGIGNEISFHIFDYPPQEELRVRDHIKFLVEYLPKKRPGLRVAYVNLFEIVIDTLRERKYLEKSFAKQREKGDDVLLSALKGILNPEKIAKQLAALIPPDNYDLVLMCGVGSVYPLVRTHTLLSNLHAHMDHISLVLFFPGEYDSATLRLFNKGRMSPGPHDEANYYRAFRLID